MRGLTCLSTVQNFTARLLASDANLATKVRATCAAAGAGSVRPAVTPPGFYTSDGMTQPCPEGAFRADWVPREQAPACTPCGVGLKADKTGRITQILPDGTEVLLAITLSADDCCECLLLGPSGRTWGLCTVLAAQVVQAVCSRTDCGCCSTLSSNAASRQAIMWHAVHDLFCSPVFRHPTRPGSLLRNNLKKVES